jgi:hypothetical protein
MLKLTQDWFYLEDGDRKALSQLLGKDFTDVVMVSRKQLINWLATIDRVSKDSSLGAAAIYDRLVDEADRVGINGL